MTFPAWPNKNECSQIEYHGNPFRYCGVCGWMEIPEGKFEAKPAEPIKTPDYVFDLVRALKDNTPLNFQGHEVPLDVQQELAKLDWVARDKHSCIINAERDRLAFREQYLIGCVCHMGSHQMIWQPGDPPFICNFSGTTIADVRDLVPPAETV